MSIIIRISSNIIQFNTSKLPLDTSSPEKNHLEEVHTNICLYSLAFPYNGS